MKLCEILSFDKLLSYPKKYLVYLATALKLREKLVTAQKMKFSIKDFFSKCDQIPSFLRIWSNLLKKSLMENSIFCAVLYILWL